MLYKLDGGIEHILIDEAQDTNQAQWDIVRALAEEFFTGLGVGDDERPNPRTVFAVGDIKQSIYSFQRADPRLFDENRDHFAARGRGGGPAVGSGCLQCFLPLDAGHIARRRCGVCP